MNTFNKNGGITIAIFLAIEMPLTRLLLDIRKIAHVRISFLGNFEVIFKYMIYNNY